jgi:hypothetical protein
MKKILHLILCILALQANATVRTVSNSPATPAQYTTLQAAVNASASGDTIYVVGSPALYVLDTLALPLTILGPGYNPQKQRPYPAQINTLQIFPTASGSNLIGLNIYNLQWIFDGFASGTTSNIVFQYDSISYVYGTGSTSQQVGGLIYGLQNISFFSSHIYWLGYPNGNNFNTINNIMVKNNIINRYSAFGVPGTVIPDVTIDHNLFTAAIGTIDNGAVFSNNIIIGSSSSLSGTNCSLENNVSVYTPATAFTCGGTGNVLTNDTMVADMNFVCATAGTQSCNATPDFALLATSVGHNYSTDATDVGVYGGTGSNYFWSGEPYTFPVVSKFNILNSSVTQGGTLNIHVESRKAEDEQQ